MPPIKKRSKYEPHNPKSVPEILNKNHRPFPLFHAAANLSCNIDDNLNDK